MACHPSVPFLENRLVLWGDKQGPGTNRRGLVLFPFFGATVGHLKGEPRVAVAVTEVGTTVPTSLIFRDATIVENR